MTRTYKYKKAEVSRESFEPGDYFVDKADNVSILNETVIKQLEAGELNTII